MLDAVVEELVPEMSSGQRSNAGVLMFALGFTLMMALDVALGQGKNKRVKVRFLMWAAHFSAVS